MNKLCTAVEKVIVKQASADSYRNKESDLWRLVNGLKKKGVRLSEKSIFELKKKKGIPLPPGDLADEVNAQDKESTITKEADAAEYDPYTSRNPRSLKNNINIERAKLRLRQRQSNLIGALLGAGLGGLGGAVYGSREGSKESPENLAGMGALGGAAAGWLGSTLLDRLTVGQYEKDLEEIAKTQTLS